MTARRNERGMVLLLVLLVVTLLAAVLTNLSFSTLVDLRLAETFRDTTRASYLARGGLQVGQMLLLDDTNGYDARDELWAIGVQQYPVADGSVTIEIADLGGRINLNRLIRDGAPDGVIKPRYRRLLVELDVDRPDALIDALVDWIDADNSPEPDGAEDAVYTSRQPPYRCKNGKLDSIDELTLIDGYTPEVLALLRPHVTVHSGGSLVNVNTASREVLLALSEDIDVNTVELLLTSRREQPFTALSQVQTLLDNNTIYGSIHSYIDVKSDFFRVDSTGWVNDGRATLQAVVSADGNKILFQRVL